MNKRYFTVGPSHLYPTVHKHIKNALEQDVLSLSHRGKVFTELFRKTQSRLRELLSIPEEFHIVFLSSATEAMERIVQNTVDRTSVHLSSGAFGKKFYQIAKDYQKQAELLTINIHEPFNPMAVTLSPDTELMTFTQSETSTGWMMPVNSISALGNRYPDTLIALDIVSSAPYVSVDFSCVDMTFFSVQKGFGLPAGLGVLIISPRAYEKSLKILQQGKSIGSFHSFPSLIEGAKNAQTYETPNVLGMYLFHQVVGDMLGEGIASLRSKTDKKAARLYTFLSEHPDFQPVIPIDAHRSRTVIVAEHRDTSRVHQRLDERGIIVGKGYGENKEKHIRIANFPSLTEEDVEQFINAVA